MSRACALEKIRGWLAIVGIALGLIAISLSIYFNHSQNVHTERALHSSLQSQCARQRDAAKQWQSVVVVVRDLQEEQSPGSTSSPQFQEFVTRTEAIYNKTPACALADKN